MDKQSTTYDVATEEDMTALGKKLGNKLSQELGKSLTTNSSTNSSANSAKPSVWLLSGDLGVGKSVLARSIIRSLGHVGAVKSPTYTLVETYDLPELNVAHLDLYRLNDPEELHYMGFEDIVDNSDLLLIEWPDKGAGVLPPPTLEITIEYAKNGRTVTALGDALR